MFITSYGGGSTVGCGINYQHGEYFFTRNGSVICKSHFPSNKQPEGDEREREKKMNEKTNAMYDVNVCSSKIE